MTRLAVLIDAVTTSDTQLQQLMDEIAKLGDARIRRAYGDWTTPEARAWQAALQRYAIEPVQEFSREAGPSPALIIDAMDLMHEQAMDAVCLVSSDPGLTRLASRLRKQGVAVHGFGGQPAPQALSAACDSFVQLPGAAGVRVASVRMSRAEPAAPRPAARVFREADDVPRSPVTAPWQSSEPKPAGRVSAEAQNTRRPSTAVPPPRPVPGDEAVAAHPAPERQYQAPEPGQPAAHAAAPVPDAPATEPWTGYRPAPQGGVTYDFGKILQRAVDEALDGRTEPPRSWQ